MTEQAKFITGSEVLDRHYEKSTQHATIQALLDTLLETYPDQLDKDDFRKLMKNLLPWYDDENIDNLFDLIDAEKCHLTHRIPKNFCTHELTNIVMKIIKAHDNWRHHGSHNSSFLGDPEVDEKVMSPMMDTLAIDAPYGSRDNRSGHAISQSMSAVTATGMTRSNRSGPYGSGSYYDGTESMQNVFIQGATGSLYDSRNPRTTQSLVRAIAAQGNAYELELENQRLRGRIAELEKWIEEIGKPSEILAAKLEDSIQVYRQEEQHRLEEIAKLERQHSALQDHSRSIQSMSQMHEMLIHENQSLRQHRMATQRNIFAADNQLKSAKKRIATLEQINHELSKLNERYRKETATAVEQRDALQEEVQNLTACLIESEYHIEQLLESHEQHQDLQEQHQDLHEKLENMENHLTVGAGGNHNMNQEVITHRMQNTYDADEMQQALSEMKLKPIHDSRHSFASDYSAAGSVRAYLLKRQSTAGTFHSTISRKSRRHLFQALHHAHMEMHEDDEWLNDHSRSDLETEMISDRGLHTDTDRDTDIETDHSQSPKPSAVSVVSIAMAASPQIVVTTATTASESAHTAASILSKPSASVPIGVSSNVSNSRKTSRPQTSRTRRSSGPQGPRSSQKAMSRRGPMLFNETLVEEAITKEAEIEIREEIKKEMEEHFENEKAQIKVDAHSQIAAAKMEYEEETAKLKDDLVKLQEEKYNQMLEFKRKLFELEERMNHMKANSGSGSGSDTPLTPTTPYMEVPDEYLDSDEGTTDGKRGSRTKLLKKQREEAEENEYNICTMLFKNMK